MFISINKDVKSYVYEYYIPVAETKKKVETSLWVVHLTQPVYTESLFCPTHGQMLPLLHCMCGWLAQWAK